MDEELIAPPAVASFGLFIKLLLERGEVVVAKYREDSTSDASADGYLVEYDRGVREDQMAGIPALDTVAARWAAFQFYLACQFLVCREVAAERVTAALEAPCPYPRTASTDYSVDLTFRFLPDLWKFANRLAPSDALVACLHHWAQAWPLSSVGIPLTGDYILGDWFENAALRRLYSDRVLERDAVDRLTDARVRALLNADLGAHRELSPALEAHLDAIPIPNADHD